MTPNWANPEPRKLSVEDIERAKRMMDAAASTPLHRRPGMRHIADVPKERPNHPVSLSLSKAIRKKYPWWRHPIQRYRMRRELKIVEKALAVEIKKRALDLKNAELDLAIYGAYMLDESGRHVPLNAVGEIPKDVWKNILKDSEDAD